MVLFPSTESIPDSILSSPLTSVQAGSLLFTPGSVCSNFLYLVSGTVRVELLSESGSSILLYRLNAHSTCVLTTSCLLGNAKYCAQATVESDASAYMMNAQTFRGQLLSSTDFQGFVFSTYANRLADMMSKVNQLAFQSVDKRLANAIIDKADNNLSLQTTHDQLATDIGTAREVVSRKLAQWETRGLIQRGRGGLQITDIHTLRTLALILDN